MTLLPTDDPTTVSIEAGNAERDRLRAEVLRLSQALVAAYTDSVAVSADRDRLGAEVDRLKNNVGRLKNIGDALFVEGYDQAVCEIRDYFMHPARKAQETDVAAEIEKIWMKDKLS